VGLFVREHGLKFVGSHPRGAIVLFSAGKDRDTDSANHGIAILEQNASYQEYRSLRVGKLAVVPLVGFDMF